MFGMDSFEFNKIAGAVLGTLLFMMGVGILGDILFSPRHAPVVPAMRLPEAEERSRRVRRARRRNRVPLPVLLAKADPPRARRRPRSARPATLSRRAAPTRSAPASGTS